MSFSKLRKKSIWRKCELCLYTIYLLVETTIVICYAMITTHLVILSTNYLSSAVYLYKRRVLVWHNHSTVRKAHDCCFVRMIEESTWRYFYQKACLLSLPIEDRFPIALCKLVFNDWAVKTETILNFLTKKEINANRVTLSVIQVL